MRRVSAVLLLMLCLAIPESNAQVDTTLAWIRAGNVKSATADFPMYYSSGYNRRVEGITELLGAADALMRDSLGVGVNLSVAVLSIREWAKMGFGTYGEAFISSGRPWVVVFPAAPLRSVPFSPIRDAIGADGAEMMVDNFGFHEVGHAYVSEYFYADGIAETRRIHWLDEFLAQYFAHTFLAELASERLFAWDQYSRAALIQYAPMYGSLEEFDREFYTHFSSTEGRADFNWFQANFAARVDAVYLKHGLGFLRKVKEELSWDNYDEWTTESVLDDLELIAPGFKNWAGTIWE